MKYSDIVKKLNEKSAYHGTNTDFDQFDYNYIGKGNDNYGYGFYFAHKKDSASGYGKHLKTVSLDIKKPILIDGKENTGWPTLTKAQVKKLIITAPDYKESLENFGDISYEGLNKVLNTAIDQISVYGSFFSIMNDFYTGHPKEFLHNMNKVTGYDGVEVSFDNGDNITVAWFPHQIKIEKSVNESFDMSSGGGSSEFKYQDTVITYGVSSDGTNAEIILVKTPKNKRGKGSARNAIQEFLKHTDRLGLTVFLTPEPMDKGINKKRLEDFYKSFGFVMNCGRNKDYLSRCSMIRSPKK